MNRPRSRLFSIFEEFRKMPKGVLIDMPGELVATGFVLNPQILKIISADNASVYFTRRTLKHLSEKRGEGRLLLDMIPHVLKHPHAVYDGKGTRVLVSKATGIEKEGEFYIVVVEPANYRTVIITAFVAKQKYLKNFEILWRTAASL